jgi:hypothetical protein
MKRKFLIGLLIFLGITFVAFPQTNEEHRYFYVDAGIGFSIISYRSILNDIFKLIDGYGFERRAISLDLSIGWAVSQNLYIVSSLCGFGDRLYQSSDYLQLNTYLFGIGIRLYPLPSKKYFQFGIDMGLGKMVMQSSIYEMDDLVSESGISTKISVAYDFNSTMTGTSFLLGSEFLIGAIEDEIINGLSFFAKFCIK